MELGMIGLGRMGNNMVRRLLRPGTGASFTTSMRKPSRHSSKRGRSGQRRSRTSSQKLSKPRAVWMMVPAAAVDPTLRALVPLLERDDVVIDGGNSHYHDDIRRAAELRPAAFTTWMSGPAAGSGGWTADTA